MEADFAVIIITPVRVRRDELRFVTTLLDSGIVDRVHLRHPDADKSAIADILASLRPEHLSRISLHDHYDLASRFDGIGIHFNSRNPRCDIQCSGLRSAGVHNTDELAAAKGVDYVLASPVFDSVSKPGYKANPDIVNVIQNADMPIIALGGVTPDRFDGLKKQGFAGGAMLGFADVPFADLNKVLDSIRKNLNK